MKYYCILTELVIVVLCVITVSIAYVRRLRDYRFRVPSPEWLYHYHSSFQIREYANPARFEFFIEEKKEDFITAWFIKKDLAYLKKENLVLTETYLDEKGYPIKVTPEFLQGLARYHERKSILWNRTQGRPERAASIASPYFVRLWQLS